MLKSRLLLALAFNISESNSFRITYPQSGDLVNVYNGLTTNWSYDSLDSILLPLSIQYVAASHQEESPTYIKEDLNITLGTFTIEIRFSLAEYYLLRFIYGNNEYETGHFEITTSEQSKNASGASGPASHLVQSTPLPSISILPTAESSTTETSSLLQGTNSPSGSDAAAAATEIPNVNENNDNGLNTGTKIGIGIGCAAAAIIGAVGLFIFYRFKKKSKRAPEEPPNPPSVGPIEMEPDRRIATRKIFEVDGNHEVANMPELPSHPFPSSELPG